MRLLVVFTPIDEGDLMTLRWYLGRDNRTKYGPYSMDELKQFADTGRLSLGDMLLPEGAKKWVTATSLQDLLPKGRALSIRQPFAELIVTGQKVIENRSRRTRIRGRVYIYACKTRSNLEEYEDENLNPEELPHGVLVGTVEIVNCIEDDDGDFEWHLANPQRLTKPLPINSMPQPGFFWPFGKLPHLAISPNLIGNTDKGSR